MERRKFFKDSCSFCLAAIGTVSILSFLESCSTMDVLHTTITNNTLLIPLSELEGKESLIVKSKSSEYDIAMIKQKSEEWKALLMMCTHQSNPVHFDGDSFRCKVHFSEFNKDGIPFSGPARKPLIALAIQKRKDHYQIDIPVDN